MNTDNTDDIMAAIDTATRELALMDSIRNAARELEVKLLRDYLGDLYVIHRRAKSQDDKDMAVKLGEIVNELIKSEVPTDPAELMEHNADVLKTLGLCSELCEKYEDELEDAYSKKPIEEPEEDMPDIDMDAVNKLFRNSFPGMGDVDICKYAKEKHDENTNMQCISKAIEDTVREWADKKSSELAKEKFLCVCKDEKDMYDGLEYVIKTNLGEVNIRFSGVRSDAAFNVLTAVTKAMKLSEPLDCNSSLFAYLQ